MRHLASMFIVIGTIFSSVQGHILQALVQISFSNATASGTLLLDSAPKPEGLVMGDILLEPQRNAIRNQWMRWPRGQVAYVISSAYGQTFQNTILAAMREIEKDVNVASPAVPCIQFIPRTTERNYLEIHPGNGCYSSIGMVNKGKQDVVLGSGCETKGTVMHELLHSLGFWHEHNRYDRDTYININISNVQLGQQVDFTKATTGQMDTLSIGYDFSSIMHYGPYTLAKDRSIPVITPKAGMAVGLQMGQRWQLSNLDVLKIQRLYSCTEDTSHITRAVTPDSFVNCHFQDGFCNLVHDPTSNCLWTKQNGSSGAGPNAGNSNGADPYIVATAMQHTGLARIETPMYNRGTVCLDFYLFQPGPTSYLNLVAQGPLIGRVSFRSLKDSYHNYWFHSLIDISVPDKIEFKVVFEAYLDLGDVAIDDLIIYPGKCL